MRSENPEKGSALVVLAGVHLDMGDLEASLVEHLELEALYKNGPNAGELPAITHNIAYVLCRLDRCEEARPRLVECLASLAQEDPLWPFLTSTLARAELAAGECTSAVALTRTAIPVARERSGEEPSELVAELLWTSAACKSKASATRAEGSREAAEALRLLRLLGKRIDATAELSMLAAGRDKAGQR
jgi:hypothetical protein